MIIYKYPILDVKKKLFGYELFLKNSKENTNPDKETSIIMNTLLEEDPKILFSGKKVLIPVSPTFIETSLFDLLPTNFVVMKVKSVREVSERFKKLVEELLYKGFEIAIDDFSFKKVNYLPLLENAKYVYIDVKKLLSEDYDEVREMLLVLKSLDKKIVFKNVESEKELEFAKKFGDLFLGNFVSSPSPLINVRNMLVLKKNIVKLYEAIERKNLEEIVRIIESDVSLTYKLLKFVKSAYPGKSEDISSVSDAILFLSLNNIANFLLIILMSEYFAGKREEEIIKRSLFRAVLARELSKLFIPECEKEAYTIGLFSLIDKLMDVKPAELARELNLGDEVVEALERRYNEFGFLLSLVELLEERYNDENIVKHVAKLIKANEEKVREAIKTAVEETEKFTQ